MTHTVQLRWEDIDGLGHVGYGVVLTYLEEGRDAFLHARGIGRHDYVVGRCEVTYKREIVLESGHVHATCEVTRLGRSSLTTRETLLDADGAVYVEADVSIVLWDGERRGPRPITPHERRALAATEEAAR